ncbi:hypothetical protein N7453_007505 [Penicillium expansum]|nr:hypothetical protein N7453_007505 [Penicillium expansum]
MASEPQDSPSTNPWITSDGSPLRGYYWMRTDPKVQPNYWVERGATLPGTGEKTYFGGAYQKARRLLCGTAGFLCITKFLLIRCRFVSQREEGSSVTQRLQFTQEQFSIAIL